jgi:hypothetical protein
MDEPAYLRACGSIVETWLAGLADTPGLEVERRELGVVGEPVAHAYVRLASGGSAARDTLMAALLAGDPGVATRPFREDWIALNPMFVESEEAPLVVERLRAEVAAGPWRQ